MIKEATDQTLTETPQTTKAKITKSTKNSVEKLERSQINYFFRQTILNIWKLIVKQEQRG